MSHSLPIPRLNVTKSLQSAPGRTALVLAGGGVAGGVYELGVLQALDELFIDRTVNDFDIYAGTSVGSLIAACLANGFGPGTIFEALNGDHPEIAPIIQRDLLNFDRRSLVRSAAQWPRHLFDTGLHYMRNSTDFSLIDLFWSFLGLLPPSLYASEALESYTRNALLRLGGRNDFTLLPVELDIIATDLHSSQRAVFNRETTPDVPISQAIVASSAVPLLYKPVQIGGRTYVDGAVRGNASLDLAVERGATLVICVNPLAPLAQEDEPELPAAALEADNMQIVINQVFRTIFHANLHYHVKHLSRLHPEVDFLIFEPATYDYDMSQQNVMRYSTRRRIMDHAYRSVSVHLARHYDVYSTILAQHEIPTAARLSPSSLERIVASDYDDAITRGELEREHSLSYREHAGSPIAGLVRALGELEIALERLG